MSLVILFLYALNKIASGDESMLNHWVETPVTTSLNALLQSPPESMLGGYGAEPVEMLSAMEPMLPTPFINAVFRMGNDQKRRLWDGGNFKEYGGTDYSIRGL